MKNIHPVEIRSTAEGRYALRVTSRLNESAENLPADITERLRVARQQALLAAAASRATTVPVASLAWAMSTGKGSAGPGESPWLRRLLACLPLVVLVAGLLVIQELHSSLMIATAAEIDAALLADDLPPDAYQDVGFLEYLKRPPEME